MKTNPTTLMQNKTLRATEAHTNYKQMINIQN